MLAGCHTAPKSPNTATSGDNEPIRQVLQQWKAAFEAGDLTHLLALYSDQFDCNGKNKSKIASELDEMIKEGRHNDVKINIVITDITRKGNRATALPIALCGHSGSDTLRLEFVNENGSWLITGMDDK